MNKRYLILTILLGFICPEIYSQHVILKDYHAAMEGDTILKQEVEYKDPGRTGRNVLWNFSRLQALDDSYKVVYKRFNDSTLIGKEHQTNYFYTSTGDTLYSLGYDNVTTHFDYVTPELLLAYPYAYGDSISRYYYGEGIYGRKLRFSSAGSSSVVADAYGSMVLPEGDTLRNVLRLHYFKRLVNRMGEEDSILFKVNKDSTLLIPSRIEMRLKNDSVRFETHSWKWYARGYRYPVFELRRDCTVIGGKEQNYFNNAYYYPPEEQIIQQYDEQNMALRWLDEEQRRDEQSQGGDGKEPGSLSEKDVAYNFYYHAGTSALNIEFHLQKDASAVFCLYDMQGRLIWRSDETSFTSGMYEMKYDLSALVSGNYILSLKFDTLLFTEKLQKR